jgi:hypothetical protein
MANNNNKKNDLDSKMTKFGKEYLSCPSTEKKRIKRKLEEQMPDPQAGFLSGGLMSNELRKALESSKKQRIKGAVDSYVNDCCKKYTMEELEKDDGKLLKQVNAAVEAWFKQMKANKVVALDRSFTEDNIPEENDDAYLEIRPHAYAGWCGLDYGRGKIVSFDPMSNDDTSFSLKEYMQRDTRHDHAWFKSDEMKKLLPPPKLRKLIKGHINYQIY